MSKIFLDVSNGILEVSSYDGSSAKEDNYCMVKSAESLPDDQNWNFLREGNNHSYVRGNVSYKGRCSNNLIISPYKNNIFVDVRNAFIFVDEFNIEIFPVSNIPRVINIGKKLLSNQIKYIIPKSVFERENLSEKDTKELKIEIRQRFGIKVKEISMISCGRTKNGIYYAKGEDEEEYVLKFRGRDKKKAELLSKIAEAIPIYFPKHFHRIDNLDFTFKIGEELYGLEEFVNNISPKIRNLEYFYLLGKHAGLLHNYFSKFIEKNEGAEDILFSMERNNSESSIISFYLDLLKSNKSHGFLLSELEEIINKNLVGSMSSLTRSLIHRDLNHSNLIWHEINPKIIDCETIENSTKINEFESPLLFGGNMKNPEYIRNSLRVMTNVYSKFSKIPLSKKELGILPLLLKYALLRNFVIKTIRRGVKDDNLLNEIKNNLENLEGDL